MPTTSPEVTAAATAPRSTNLVAMRALPHILTIGGAIGFLAAFTLAIEKLAVLKDSTYTPKCSINPILSCGSVMNTP